MPADRGPLRTAVLGTGSSLSVFHLPSILLLRDKFTLHSIFERVDRGRLVELKEGGHLDGVKVVRTYQEVLDDVEVDLVVVSTPNITHYEYAKAALEAGKHVLIEKPVCTKHQEAAELYATAEARGLIMGVYQNRRWDSDFLTLRRIMDSGRLGEVLHLTSRYDRYRPLPPSYDAETNTNWKELPGQGNESIFNLGSHIIDQAVVLFGPPDKVGGRCWDQRGTGLDESFSVELYYPGRMAPRTVSLGASIISAQPDQLRFHLQGSLGSYIKHTLPTSHPALANLPSPATHEGFSAEPEAGWGSLYLANEPKDGTGFTKERVPAVEGNYIALYADLYDAIIHKDQSRLSVSKDQVLAVLRIIELARESSNSGRILPFSA
ncbi:hypothetical protein IAU60_001333 [Kwoniella sp. DSM 27419]